MDSLVCKSNTSSTLEPIQNFRCCREIVSGGSIKPRINLLGVLYEAKVDVRRHKDSVAMVTGGTEKAKESVREMRITILHQSSEAVRNFDSLCSVKSNSASTSVYNMPMISGYVLIKSTLELGMCIG